MLEHRPDFTGDSEQIANKLGDRAATIFSSHGPSPNPKGANEALALLKGIESPKERTDLYDNFDIHHDKFLNHSEGQIATAAAGGGGTVTPNQGADSPDNTVIDSVKTLSAIASSRALIPETGIEKRAHTRNGKAFVLLCLKHCL